MKTRLTFKKTNVFYLATVALSAGLSLLISTLSSLTPSATAQATKWSSGFYRAGNRDVVIYLAPDEKTSCYLVNEDQLAAYGGQRIVTQVAPNSTFEAGRTSQGPCRWPNGFYQDANTNETVRLFGRHGRYFLCTVATDDILRRLGGAGQVRVVAHCSQLEVDRKSDGECKV